MKVILKKELKPQWHIHNLTDGKIYDVIEIMTESYRLVDDKNDPVLFDKRAFEIIDNRIPDDWVYQVWLDDGEIFPDPEIEGIFYQKCKEFYSLMPKCFSEPNNFFERYHDSDPECMQVFNEYLSQQIK